MFIADLKRYTVICSAIAVFFTLCALFFTDESYAFWEWVIITILYTLIPSVFVTIANFLRRLAMPSSIITDGGMTGLLKKKTYWAVGPQIIGWLLGIWVAVDILNKFFDITVQ